MLEVLHDEALNTGNLMKYINKMLEVLEYNVESANTDIYNIY